MQRALAVAWLAFAAACTSASTGPGGAAGSSSDPSQGSGTGSSTSAGGTSTGTGAPSGDPFVGSWESEYDTEGHLDTFEIRSDLTGVGKYYSVLPGTECEVQITARHGNGPGVYEGLLNFGPPCSSATPMLTFSCTLVNGGSRLECGGDKSYRRVGSITAGGTGGTPAGGAGGATGSGAGGNGGAGPAGAGGSGEGASDPFVGSWESEYVTLGQHDQFAIARDLTGAGTYYSVVPGVACKVDLTTMRGPMPDTYVGTVDFGTPCDAVTPTLAFLCTLTNAAARLVCGNDKNYRRVR